MLQHLLFQKRAEESIEMKHVLIGVIVAILAATSAWAQDGPWPSYMQVDTGQHSRGRKVATSHHQQGLLNWVESAIARWKLAFGQCPEQQCNTCSHSSCVPNGCQDERQRCAVECTNCGPGIRGGWQLANSVQWQQYDQGEYVGHARLPHVPEYRLRVDDELEIVYRLTREKTTKPYRLGVGDVVKIESMTDPTLNREVSVQPDGTITLLLLGQVPAVDRTIEQLREDIEKRYKKYYKVPAITVTPIKLNTKLEDLRASVDARYGAGGQTRRAVVTPEGTIALPVIGSVPAQGLTLSELQAELNERYREVIEGIEVIPVLVRRAPRYVYILGEVANPGRYELTGPTTVMQALAMAGSFNVGANLRQVVIFRRTEDWRLMATIVNLHGALYGKTPCPAGEIWLNDSDVILVPKSPILVADEFIELIFTRGIYGVFPLNSTINFSKLSTI